MALSEIYHVRLSAVERQALERLARRDYRSPAQMLRLLIRREAAKKGVWPPEVERELKDVA